MSRIVIIEDEALIRDLLEMKLKEEGFEVLSAEDGEKGLELIEKERPDLIILDIVMPKKTGFEVLEEMKKKGLSDIPVIVISNSGQPVELSEAQKMGASDWLIKTEFDPQEVLEKVKKYIRV